MPSLAAVMEILVIRAVELIESTKMKQRFQKRKEYLTVSLQGLGQGKHTCQTESDTYPSSTFLQA